MVADLLGHLYRAELCLTLRTELELNRACTGDGRWSPLWIEVQWLHSYCGCWLLPVCVCFWYCSTGDGLPLLIEQQWLHSDISNWTWHLTRWRLPSDNAKRSRYWPIKNKKRKHMLSAIQARLFKQNDTLGGWAGSLFSLHYQKQTQTAQQSATAITMEPLHPQSTVIAP